MNPDYQPRQGQKRKQGSSKQGPGLKPRVPEYTDRPDHIPTFEDEKSGKNKDAVVHPQKQTATGE